MKSFYFFLLKIDHFRSFNVFLKKQKLKENLQTLFDKSFEDIFAFQQNFSSTQVEWNQIIITKKLMYKLPHQLSNDLRLRILGNQKISRKSLKHSYLMAITQPTTRKPNFDVFGNNWQKISSKAFHRKTYFALFCEFVHNLLSKIVAIKIISLESLHSVL